MTTIYNEDCAITLQKIKAAGQTIDIVLTSPPYNTSKNYNTEKGREVGSIRYDIPLDNKTADEYCAWCVDIFNAIDQVLSKDGVILWNASYGNDTRDNPESIGLLWLSIAEIIRKTCFTVADRIVWKKSSAFPINTSKNKLTRICEDIFVFCRKSEIKTFNANKEITGTSVNGQNYYKIFYNFVEAKNNDGTCKLNKATYSSELCEKLLHIYAQPGAVVYDPFIGTGTTAVACKRMGLDCIGSELSAAQCEFAETRITQAT